MFWSGAWKRSDFTNVMGVNATLGGAMESHKNTLDKLIEKES